MNSVDMADSVSNSKTINRAESGFPPYLDFNKLRDDSISYLGDLTGKIWTDYNLHDPGITTLEMLCYALLDLGYRTNFPTVDLLTRDPGDTSDDNNFFTPSQLLTCNPLTIIDYRKLLIDIDGVKNAWLEVATDVVDICKHPQGAGPAGIAVNNPGECITYLNGLYHVYIELEEEKTDPTQQKLYEKLVLGNVRDALMLHRNLCEDFADIYILCKLNVGICADIDLEADANAETVYKALISALQDFMDPSPKFYTLQELLNKPKAIEDIFSGRPYNVTTSHGFVDTDELKQITLKKEIHLSDLYQLAGAIPGVRTVRRLQLQVCQNNTRVPVTGWKYQLPRNSIPVFSTGCSGIQFWQNGRLIQADLSKFNQYLDLRFSTAGKILFTERYPYLDAKIPTGVYRKNIDEYYSIQHEYPRVYGIGDGGLPDDAPVKRQAQALQFKGYLLFFDQLLANYLEQLKNIRSLFSFSSPSSNASLQTYYWQEPDTIPGFEKLLRFDNAAASNASNSFAVLATPVNKADLMNVLSQPTINSADIEALPMPYYFASETERDIAIAQLMEDFGGGQSESVLITSAQAENWFYFESSSNEWVIISRKYSDLQSLTSDLVSLQYLATSQSNYTKNISPAGSSFSFVINTASSGYLNFLQRISESKELYAERRNAFLDHLLSRFSEQFADYALLLFDGGKEKKAQGKLIRNKENFLSNYGVLSSNRGKAFDYLANPFSRDNVSGFENRVAALAGWNNCGSVSLCNFVVEEFEEQFILFVKLDDDVNFTSEDKFYSKDHAEQAVRSLFNALQSESSFHTWHDRNDDVFKLQVSFGENKTAILNGLSSPAFYEMQALKSRISRLFARVPVSNAAFTSQTVFRMIIKNNGEELFSSKQYFHTESEARTHYKNTVQNLRDPKHWDILRPERNLVEKIYVDKRDTDTIRYINLEAFNIDINHGILGKPDKFNFEILDLKHHFKIESDDEFDSFDAAEDAVGQFLVDISDTTRYTIDRDPNENKFRITTLGEDNAIAQKGTVFTAAKDAQQAADELSGYAQKNLYTVSIEEKGFRYRFEFYLDSVHGQEYVFRSIEEFDEPGKAHTAVAQFYQDLPSITTRLSGSALQLVRGQGNNNLPIAQLAGPEDLPPDPVALKNAIDHDLDLKKKIMAVPLGAEPSVYEEFVNNDIQNKDQKYVYRLVDKDHLHAFYIGTEKEKESFASATAKKTELFQDCRGYDYIEICLGGDIFCVRVDEKTGQLWYHFQLKVNHPVFAGEESILFESVQGYSSEEDAQAAFDEVYVEIMNRAMLPANYGAGQYISLDEIIVEGGSSNLQNKAIVFVPIKTQQVINANSQAQLVDTLVVLAKKYPLRKITNDCTDRKEWKKRFPCLPIPGEESMNCDDCNRCNDEGSILTFYYYVLADKKGNEKWQSVCCFTTDEEARLRFHFFVLLLCYPGNYYVDVNRCHCTPDEKHNCKCQWEIYIREVLAESKTRYVSEDSAWAAVEEFICISQSHNSFHRYFNKKLCGNSFFVACATGGLAHPCWYYSERKRNHVLDRLFKTAKAYFGSGHISFFSVSTPYAVYDIDGNEIAQFPSGGNQNDLPAFCSRFIRLAEYCGEMSHYNEKDDGFYLLDDTGQVVVFTNDKTPGLRKWQELLREAAYFFPVVKTVDDNGKLKYCVEIHLPHFNHSESDEADDGDCGCNDKPVKSPDDCWVAWKSVCCFKTCAGALDFYFKEIVHLTDYNNYRAVFECDCGGYGIELIRDDEIVAINPQRYPTVKSVCEAIERARCLINCEGLHLVEHILLRPRCAEDCNCDYFKKACDNNSGCQFVWDNGDQDDPCNPQKKICFVPGADPYSFVATVVLPAWTRRMRKKENQQIVEDLLYREAPAHVLLRIIWVTPKDLFLFEDHFKKWAYWLSWNQDCTPAYRECDFLKFLFDTQFKCLHDCNTCLPCPDDDAAPVACFTDPCDVLSDPGPYAFLSQVNETFCWAKLECDEKKEVTEKAGAERKVLATESLLPPAPAVAEPAAEQAEVRARPSPKARKAIVKISEEDSDRKIDERFTRYRSNIQELINAGATNTAAGEVVSFLQLYKPGVEKFREVITNVLENEKPTGRGKRKFTVQEQRTLIHNAAFYFFDSIVFNDLKLKESKELTALFTQLKKKKLQPTRNEWNPKEVKMIKSNAPLSKIYKFLK